MTTIHEARLLGRVALRGSPTPALDARLLLEHVLARDHAYLIAHDDEPLAVEALAGYIQALQRAAAGEPIPYLTGHAPFMGLAFIVSANVLIPRPETEQLVELAIAWARGHESLRIVDIGTGSGCIAVSLAHRLPQAQVLAVDVSAAALTVAAANVARHTPGRVPLVQGDLLAAIGPGLDLIVANLPYVTGPEWPTLPIGVKSYEPPLALDGGADGLDLIRRLLPQAAARLNSGGVALLEIGWQQGHAVTGLARAAFPAAEVALQQDFAGHDRVVVITK